MGAVADAKNNNERGRTLEASVRMIIELLILGGITWLVNSNVDFKVQMASVQGQVAAISTQLADVPALKANQVNLMTRMNRNEQDVDDIKRRVDEMERNTNGRP